MGRILFRRALALLPTFLLGTLVIFAAVQLTPGGAAYTIAGTDATPEVVARINAELGLDRPVARQYLDWLRSIAEFRFGSSLVTRQSVSSSIASALPVTAVLATESLVLAVLIGVPLGMVAAVRQGGAADRVIRGITGFGIALPEFWVGMLAINLFALHLFWFPPTGFVMPDFRQPGAGLSAHLESAVLPVTTQALAATAIILRFTRSAMRDVLDTHYVRTAWSLGLPAWQIYLRFALKGALAPIVTLVGTVAAVLIGGTMMIETVFAIPGIGAMLVQSVLAKDFPIVQGITATLMLIIIAINLCVDLSVAALDPRTR